MDDITYAYAADIFKTEKAPNGDLYVFGKAAGPELDMDGQICDPVWLGKAMPKWYEFGNVRAQHQAVAAGVGTVLDDTGGGTYNLKSLVVDRDTKEKVEKKVYKGYSIGIKNARVVKDAKAPKGRIVDGDIVEISLVDRPANPTAVLAICKAAGGAMLAMDTAGMVLWVEEVDLVEKVLSGDLHKSLAAMEPEDAAAEAAEAVAELCDLIADEIGLVKSAVAEGEPYAITDLWKSIGALRTFVDDDTSEPYPGFSDDVTAQVEVLAEADRRYELEKAASLDSNTSATVLEAEITKAVAEVKTSLEAKIQSLQADLTKALAAPRSGGPVLLTQPTTQTLTKSSDADRYRAIADQTADPELKLAYQQAAVKAEVAA